MTDRRAALGATAVVGLATVFDLIVWGGDRQLRDGRELPLLLVPLLTVAVHASLLLRRRRPRTVFAVECTYALASSALVPEFQPFAGVLFALYAVASLHPPRESTLWLLAVAAPFGLQSYLTAETRPAASQISTFVLLLVVWLLVSTAVWGAGRVAYAAAQRSWRLRELQTAEAAEAVVAERARLARELHDIVSHAVTGMTLQAAGARALLTPADDRVRQSLATIEAAGEQAMSELHRMLGLLRPKDAGTTAAVGAPRLADVAGLVTLAQEAGRSVQLVEEGHPGALDPSVETAAYRVVQEGLTNSAKHAGPSADVTVRLRWSAEQLEVEVRDRRRGPTLSAQQRSALSSGSGLRGLTERVVLVGGSLSAAPVEDGYRLLARLPLARSLPAPPAAP